MTLRVIIQIVPFGVEENTREIGRLDIFNKDMKEQSTYGILDLTKGEEGLYVAEVKHWRQDGAWELVRKVVDELDL